MIEGDAQVGWVEKISVKKTHAHPITAAGNA
jgi:hypothetical protein